MRGSISFSISFVLYLFLIGRNNVYSCIDSSSFFTSFLSDNLLFRINESRPCNDPLRTGLKYNRRTLDRRSFDPMDNVIFCNGNNRYLYCRGVRHVKSRLQLIFKHENPFPKYVNLSDRIFSIPLWLESSRRKELAEFGYYASGPSEALRCYHCHTLINQTQAKNSEIPPKDLHSTSVICDFIELFAANQNREIVSCSLCFEKVRFHYTLLPCGHTGFCYRCVLRLDKCPNCHESENATILACLKTFIPFKYHDSDNEDYNDDPKQPMSL